MDLREKLPPHQSTNTQALRFAFLMRWGLTNKEAARILGCDYQTVKLHAKQACLKTGLHGRTRLAIEACRTWGFPLDGPPKDKAECDQMMESREQVMTWIKAAEKRDHRRVAPMPGETVEMPANWAP